MMEDTELERVIEELTLFLLYVTVVGLGLRAADRAAPGPCVSARLGLVLFAAVCLLLCALSNRLGLGFFAGFLVGLLPAWPFVLPVARRASERTQERAIVAFGFLAFSTHFWTSALFVLWKTRT